MSGKEYTAKSVEEALEKALNEMFLTREDIDYEVVQQPSKGFLGFGQKDAVVRVSKKVIDEVKETAKIETVKEEKAEPAVVEKAEKTEIAVEVKAVETVENLKKLDCLLHYPLHLSSIQQFFLQFDITFSNTETKRLM